jgi:hypothetical protein
MSGQLQRNRIADGAGNRPVRSAHSRAITGCDSLPASRSIREPMAPAQSRWIARHASRLTASISIATSYRLEPLTRAAILPAVIRRSITEPERT